MHAALALHLFAPLSSRTHVVLFCTLSGVKRLNLGGKALTNLLKETVSYRSLDMRDEGLLMEQLKEQLCWVSQVRSDHCRLVVGS